VKRSAEPFVAAIRELVPTQTDAQEEGAGRVKPHAGA
jgi:hypothetical protein